MTLSEFLDSGAGTLTAAYVLILFFAVAFARAQGRSTSIPNVSISLGIMFTFIGIFLALVGFDPDDIQGSIPELLDGMRLAFVTSIMGMAVAILYRITPNWGLWNSARARSEGKGATIDTLAGHLMSIERALVGDGEATLHTQLQKLRLVLVDKQDEMIREFREFAKQMAENNTEALIIALEQVMRDFNAKINEQLGDNFKRFNEGLGRMLEWQEHYRAQVGEMIAQLNRTLQSVSACEATLRTITEHSRSFAHTAEELRKVIATYDHEVQDMQAHLNAFAAVAEQAKGAFPVIEQNLTKLTRDLNGVVTQTTESIKQATEEQRRVLSRAMEETAEGLVRTSREQREVIRKMTEDTSTVIAKQIELLDEELGNELTRALSTLGSQLASLSQQFVTDYMPLTKQLHRLVQVAAAASPPTIGNNPPGNGA